MPRGGARANAGRKRGKHRNHRSYKIACEVLEKGRAEGKMSPIEVMLWNMWDAVDKVTAIVKRKATTDKAKRQQRIEEGNARTFAQDCAKDAAPYCHTRLGQLEVTGIDDGDIEHRITVEFVKGKK